MAALGGAKVRPLVFRQGGAADWLFRVSFAGTALSGGAAEPERSRKSIAALAGKAGPVTGCAHEE